MKTFHERIYEPASTHPRSSSAQRRGDARLTSPVPQRPASVQRRRPSDTPSGSTNPLYILNSKVSVTVKRSERVEPSVARRAGGVGIGTTSSPVVDFKRSGTSTYSNRLGAHPNMPRKRQASPPARLSSVYTATTTTTTAHTTGLGATESCLSPIQYGGTTPSPPYKMLSPASREFLSHLSPPRSALSFPAPPRRASVSPTAPSLTSHSSSFIPDRWMAQRMLMQSIEEAEHRYRVDMEAKEYTARRLYFPDSFREYIAPYIDVMQHEQSHRQLLLDSEREAMHFLRSHERCRWIEVREKAKEVLLRHDESRHQFYSVEQQTRNSLRFDETFCWESLLHLHNGLKKELDDMATMRARRMLSPSPDRNNVRASIASRGGTVPSSRSIDLSLSPSSSSSSNMSEEPEQSESKTQSSYALEEDAVHLTPESSHPRSGGGGAILSPNTPPTPELLVGEFTRVEEDEDDEHEGLRFEGNDDNSGIEPQQDEEEESVEETSEETDNDCRFNETLEPVSLPLAPMPAASTSDLSSHSPPQSTMFFYDDTNDIAEYYSGTLFNDPPAVFSRRDEHRQSIDREQSVATHTADTSTAPASSLTTASNDDVDILSRYLEHKRDEEQRRLIHQHRQSISAVAVLSREKQPPLYQSAASGVGNDHETVSLQMLDHTFADDHTLDEVKETLTLDLPTANIIHDQESFERTSIVQQFWRPWSDIVHNLEADLRWEIDVVQMKSRNCIRLWWDIVRVEESTRNDITYGHHTHTISLLCDWEYLVRLQIEGTYFATLPRFPSSAETVSSSAPSKIETVTSASLKEKVKQLKSNFHNRAVPPLLSPTPMKPSPARTADTTLNCSAISKSVIMSSCDEDDDGDDRHDVFPEVSRLTEASGVAGTGRSFSQAPTLSPPSPSFNNRQTAMTSSRGTTVTRSRGRSASAARQLFEQPPSTYSAISARNPNVVVAKAQSIERLTENAEHRHRMVAAQHAARQETAKERLRAQAKTFRIQRSTLERREGKERAETEIEEIEAWQDVRYRFLMGPVPQRVGAVSHGGFVTAHPTKQVYVIDLPQRQPVYCRKAIDNSDEELRRASQAFKKALSTSLNEEGSSSRTPHHSTTKRSGQTPRNVNQHSSTSSRRHASPSLSKRRGLNPQHQIGNVKLSPRRRLQQQQQQHSVVSASSSVMSPRPDVMPMAPCHPLRVPAVTAPPSIESQWNAWLSSWHNELEAEGL